MTNRGALPLFGVQAALRVPPEIVAFPTNAASLWPVCSAGATFACDALERAIWQLGTLENGQTVRMLAPGQGVTVTFATTVLSQNAPRPGSVIVFDADATANDGSQAQARHAVAVQASRTLDLELHASPEPVGQDEDLVYTVTFGNRGIGMVSNPMLELPVPRGTMLQSASDEGHLVDGAAVWALEDLAPGASGVRELRVHVDPAVAQGEPIAAGVTLAGVSGEARAQAVTWAQAEVPLTANLAIGPDPVTPGESMQVSLTVTNRGALPLFGVQAAIRMPAETSSTPTNIATGGPVCNAGATFACDGLERARSGSSGRWKTARRLACCRRGRE